MLPYVDNQLWFLKYSPIFLFLIRKYMWPLLHFFGPFWTTFLALWAISGVRVRFKNTFRTYLCRQSIRVLEIQPYLLAFNLAKFVGGLHFLGLLGLFLGLGSGSNTFLGPTYIDNQLQFQKYSHIFLFCLLLDYLLIIIIIIIIIIV